MTKALTIKIKKFVSKLLKSLMIDFYESHIKTYNDCQKFTRPFENEGEGSLQFISVKITCFVRKKNNFLAQKAADLNLLVQGVQSH